MFYANIYMMYICVYICKYIFFIPSSIRFDSCAPFIFVDWDEWRNRHLPKIRIAHNITIGCLSLLHGEVRNLTKHRTHIHNYLRFSLILQTSEFMGGLPNDFPHRILIASIALDQLFLWCMCFNHFCCCYCLFHHHHKNRETAFLFGHIFHFYGCEN